MTTKATDVVGFNATASGNTSSSNTTKPTKYPNLFYSPDYKELFNKEIQEITLELLQTAEVALSSFDFRTIDFISAYSSVISYDNFGNIVSVSEKESPQVAIPQTNATVANDVFKVAESIVLPAKDLLQQKPGSNYSSVLENYGYHSSGPDITKYIPGYNSNGQPYYDLELNLPDVGGVMGYNIYMIEEKE